LANSGLISERMLTAGRNASQQRRVARQQMTLSKRTIESLCALRHSRAVVLALQKEIAQALADGLTMSEIWQQLHEEGAFPAGYDQFRRLVRRFVTKPARKTVRASAPSPVASTGFIFNPRTNLKDLV
jgi:hypothetical protein